MVGGVSNNGDLGTAEPRCGGQPELTPLPRDAHIILPRLKQHTKPRSRWGQV